LEKLKEAGCNENNLLYWLELYTTSTQRMNQKRKASHRTGKEIDKCLTALHKASERLSALKLHPGFSFTTYTALYEQQDLAGCGRTRFEMIKKKSLANNRSRGS
jgi:hypothetical protein